jgi:hypothetical protein
LKLIRLITALQELKSIPRKGKHFFGIDEFELELVLVLASNLEVSDPIPLLLALAFLWTFVVVLLDKIPGVVSIELTE